MSPSYKHDRSAHLLAAIIEIAAEELRLPFSAAGSTTFRRKDLKSGLEPDRSFYLRNEATIRGKTEINLAVDPPPDLVIEVEISRRLMDRQRIYGKMGVPEVWLYDGSKLTVMQLARGSKYNPVNQSPALPLLPLAKVHEWVQLSYRSDEATWRRQIRAWIQEHLVGKKP